MFSILLASMMATAATPELPQWGTFRGTDLCVVQADSHTSYEIEVRGAVNGYTRLEVTRTTVGLGRDLILVEDAPEKISMRPLQAGQVEAFTGKNVTLSFAYTGTTTTEWDKSGCYGIEATGNVVINDQGLRVQKSAKCMSLYSCL